MLSENIDDSDKEEEDLIGSLSVWQRIFRRNDERFVCVHDHEEKEKKNSTQHPPGLVSFSLGLLKKVFSSSLPATTSVKYCL